MVETNIDALYLYVEVFIAFVAFATIVATIKQAFGKKLTVLCWFPLKTDPGGSILGGNQQFVQIKQTGVRSSAFWSPSLF